MVEWRKTTKKGVVAIGTKKLGSEKVIWVIKRSKGGVNYHLFLGEENSTPMYARPTVNACKVLAEAFL